MTSAAPDSRPLRVLVVDDSPSVRAFLTSILTAEPGVSVAGVAEDGEEAVAAVARLKPDVVTMDIRMPKMDGLEAIRRIMREHPLPIVVVSGQTDADEVTTTFEAIEAGAVAFLARPLGVGHEGHSTEALRFVRTVKAMSEVRVVRRWSPTPLPSRIPEAVVQESRPIEIVALGASTGGPIVLATILSLLPRDLPVPVVIVQHMAEGFIEGFSEWLGVTSGFPVMLARQGEKLRPGRAYLGPDEWHLTVLPDGSIRLVDEPPDGGLRPSIARLLASVAQSYGARSFAALLTGMGSDGATELARLRELGAATAAQDRESCVVYGMPAAAARLNAASWTGDPARLAHLIARVATAKR